MQTALAPCLATPKAPQPTGVGLPRPNFYALKKQFTLNSLHQAQFLAHSSAHSDCGRRLPAASAVNPASKRFSSCCLAAAHSNATDATDGGQHDPAHEASKPSREQQQQRQRYVGAANTAMPLSRTPMSFHCTNISSLRLARARIQSPFCC